MKILQEVLLETIKRFLELLIFDTTSKSAV